MSEPAPHDAPQPDTIEVAVGPFWNSELRRFRPGNGRLEWFKDFSIGPEMVVVPSGSFMMGPADIDIGRTRRDELPLHRVTIETPFAVGRFTVTFDDWDEAVALGLGAFSYLPDYGGWGRGKRPAVVSWLDARAYVDWLSVMSGWHYRLLTEAEWEYVARAGTRTRYWWGDSFSPELANCRPRSDPWGKGTLPVDSFAPNPWGLYQVHGNIDEWCEDAYQSKHIGYRGAPPDGSAWKRVDQRYRVKRGGSWGRIEEQARASKRIRNWAGSRSGGLRVARNIVFSKSA